MATKELVTARDLGRGLALRGTVWPGGSGEAYRGTVVIGASGDVEVMAPGTPEIPDDVPVFGGDDCWIGPGIVDAHVHLAFGSAQDAVAGGVVAVRDLGAPAADAQRWRTLGRPPTGSPIVAVAGPLLTAPMGYPSQSWGAQGFAAFIETPERARAVVQALARDGVDLVKVALERGDGWSVPSPTELRAVVEAAHDAGLAVTAHALAVDMVTRALDAGVDELCHVPAERLSDALIDRIADARVPVVSTLQTFFSEGRGADAARNAAALYRAGVPLLYGTDLGNAGTHPGVDPRELDRLAGAGLGRLGALRAATVGSARAAGMRGRTGTIAVGEAAALVLLAADPLIEPGAWRAPLLVIADGRVCGVGAWPPPTAD